MKQDIHSLVCRAQNGDKNAFGDLYELFSSEMFRYSLVMVKDEETAEDCVSEAALEAFKCISSLRDPDSFKGWLFKILNTVCKRNYIKNQKSFDMVRIDDEEVHFDIASQDADNESKVDLEQLLGCLSELEKQIVMLSIVYDYKSNEIAQIVNCNASTVRSKLKRALKKCRENMERGE